MSSFTENKTIQSIRDNNVQFEDKVKACEKTFAVNVFQDMLKNLQQRPCGKVVESSVSTMPTLRRVLDEETTRVINTYGKAQINWDPELLYFNWFIDFYDYLKQLKNTFIYRILELLESCVKHSKNQLENGSETNREENQIRHHLGDIVYHLELLLNQESEQHEEFFEPETKRKYELVDYPGSYLVKLMADVLLKMRCMAELVFRWLKCIDTPHISHRPNITLNSINGALVPSKLESQQDENEDDSKNLLSEVELLENDTKELQNALSQSQEEKSQRQLFLAQREISSLRGELERAKKEKEHLMSQVDSMSIVEDRLAQVKIDQNNIREQIQRQNATNETVFSGLNFVDNTKSSNSFGNQEESTTSNDSWPIIPPSQFVFEKYDGDINSKKNFSYQDPTFSNRLDSNVVYHDRIPSIFNQSWPAVESEKNDKLFPTTIPYNFSHSAFNKESDMVSIHEAYIGPMPSQSNNEAFKMIYVPKFQQQTERSGLLLKPRFVQIDTDVSDAYARKMRTPNSEYTNAIPRYHTGRKLRNNSPEF